MASLIVRLRAAAAAAAAVGPFPPPLSLLKTLLLPRLLHLPPPTHPTPPHPHPSPGQAAHACYSCFMEEDEAPLPVPGSMVAGIRAELQVVSQGFMMRKRQQQQQEEERSAAQETAAAAAADAAAAAEANADAAMQDAEVGEAGGQRRGLGGNGPAQGWAFARAEHGLHLETGRCCLCF